MVDNDEITQISAGRWDLPCPDVEVEGDLMGNRVVVQGHGVLSNQVPGKLTLTLYSKETPGASLRPPNFPPHCTIRATDIRGRLWRATDAWHQGSCILETSDFLTSSWKLEEVKWHHGECPPPTAESASVSFHFFHALRFDATLRTEVTERVAGENHSQRTTLNIARFQCAAFECQLRDDKGAVHFSAHCEGRPVAGFDTRLLESLQFASMQRCDWSVRRVSTAGQAIATVRPLPRPHQSCFWISRGPNQEAGPTDWELMGQYYSFIRGYAGSEWHPISRYLAGLIQASGSTAEAFTLALGTTVEGLLNELYPDKDAGQDLISGVQAARGVLKEAKRGGRLECTGPVMKAIDRCLGRLITTNGRMSARNKLLALQEEGAVKGADIEAWEVIRNLAVHPGGKPPESDSDGDTAGDPVRLLHSLLNHAIRTAVDATRDDSASPGPP